MAASTLNRVSLVSKVTLGWFSARHTRAVNPNSAATSAIRNRWPRKTLLQDGEICGLPCQFKRFRAGGQRNKALKAWDPHYPLTLIRENESTALPVVGRPIDMAGRKVVKISMFFTCEGSSLVASGFDSTR